MAAVTVRESAASVFTISESDNAALQASYAAVFAIYNFPSARMDSSQAAVFAVAAINAGMEVSAARVFALVRGRTANPRARAWTFTLDGHDFYVLRLGDRTTLIYDVYSEQWVEWTSGELAFWRLSSGQTWLGAKGLAEEYGSTVVAGDDTFGLLWFLSPEQPYDDHPNELTLPQQLPFERIVTGQVLASGRQFLPCYAILVEGDNYGLSGVDFTPSAILETSDDQGRTFSAHDTLTVVADYTDDNPYMWFSLGQIASPGRMFRVTDNGLFARIDSMEMNDAG